MRERIATSLGRKFALALTVGLLSASLLFLVLFVGLYRARLETERAQASEQVNLLLQAALENAMLKRDLVGLTGIVHRLGQQSGVRRVMIVNPSGEIRFSSSPDLIGRSFNPRSAAGCAPCHADPAAAQSRSAFLTDEEGHEILRSVNPVRNKEPCQQCHGPMAGHPINGILFVDWDADQIRASARSTTLMLIVSGGAVVLATVGGVWWLLNHLVLRRLARLTAVTAEISDGNFDIAARVDGRDEIAVLARTYNQMLATIRSRIRDIHDRETFLQSLIDAVPDGIRVIDERYGIVKVNLAYRRHLGLADDAVVIGDKCHKSTHGLSEPCPATLVTCPFEVTVREGRPVKSVHAHRRVDGGTVEVEVHASAMTLEQEGMRRAYIVESIRDLAEDIRFSHEQKLAAVGQLAAGVAHEIRNPLASIRLALQGILRDPSTDSDTSTYLRLVDGQVDKCMDITNRLLKLSANRGDQRQLIEVNGAVQETLSLLSYHAEQQGVVVQTEFDPSGPRIIAAEGDLRMVVLNLVQNAFHAMPRGGTLRVLTRQRGHLVEVGVIDTGVGIKPEHHRRIFEPFFSHRADGEGGTGLGLAICKSIAEAAGGSISVDSDVGAGATFIVALPSAQAAMAEGGARL